MQSTAGVLALMATCASGFVLPQASKLPAAAAATRSASSLRMADEPLGVGVIGCGRIGDVSPVHRFCFAHARKRSPAKG